MLSEKLEKYDFVVRHADCLIIKSAMETEGEH